MMSKYLICCDLDGTLIDTHRCVYESYKDALSLLETKVDFTFDYYCEHCKGLSYDAFLPLIVKDQNLIENVHEIKKNFYASHLNKLILNDKLVEILKAAKKANAKIALVTTATKKNAMQALEHFELQDLFDIKICQEDTVRKKPHPEAYLKAMRLANIGPEKTIIYEDSEAGAIAGIKSGATVCQFRQLS